MTINNYIKYILPCLKSFIKCDIYAFELKKIEKKMLESLNFKDMYTALDLPDFRHVKDSKLEIFIAEYVIQKLKLGEVFLISNDKNGIVFKVNNEVFQVVIFQSGTLPEISISEKKLMFFMYQPEFKTIYYCGKYELDSLTNNKLGSFYQNHCLENSNVFFDFKILKI